MNIFYILPDFDENAHSGGLYVVFEHCNGLLKRGHSVRAFNRFGKKSRYIRLDCDVEKIDDAARVLDDARCDIMVGTHWRTWYIFNMLKKAAKNATRLCLLVQSDDRYLVSEEEKPLVDRAMRQMHKGVLPVHKIAVSRFLQDVIEKDYGQKCLYVKNGLEQKSVEPMLSKTGKLRLITRQDTSAYRGWDIVDQALGSAMRQRENLEIHLYGMNKKRRTRYPAIYHRGLTGDRLLGLFKSCDIYVSGALREGFSYPLIEAMSQGLCIASTDAGGNKEFCVDGQTALLSPSGDAEALCRNILRLIDNPTVRERLKTNGFDKTKEFMWQDSINQLERVFESILSCDYAGDRTVSAQESDMMCGCSKRALFIYGKDPFGKYKNWERLEQFVTELQRRGFILEVYLFINRHTLNTAKARLKMLAGFEYEKKFVPKVYYIKKTGFLLTGISRLLFSASVALRIILNANSARNKYDHVFFFEGGFSSVKLLCGMLRIGFSNVENFLTK